MDTKTKMEIVRDVASEIVTEQELEELFETKEHPIAYDGFEPSGIANIAFGVYRPLVIEELRKTGIRFKLLLADSFAWINNKMGGDLEKIRMVGEYFIEVWNAAGLEGKVQHVWHKEHFDDPEYWKKVIRIAKSHTLKRTIRAMTIAGRTEAEIKETAMVFYPSMQAADIFQLEADICQLGLDQRKVNMLAREVGPELGYWKPVVVSHRMLLGLLGPRKMGFDEDEEIDTLISSKMSKSKPESGIFVHDSREDIFRKIRNAYCPKSEVKDNPIVQYVRELIFRKYGKFRIERDEKFGGDIEFGTYQEFEEAWKMGEIHPLDLKNAVAAYIDDMVKPIREHFQKGKAKELYEHVRSLRITR